MASKILKLIYGNAERLRLNIGEPRSFGLCADKNGKAECGHLVSSEPLSIHRTIRGEVANGR